MELRYCEKCGDVIRVETAGPLNPAEHFVCDGCQSGAGGSRSTESGSSGDYEDSLRQEELNLFSPGTIAVRKKELEDLAREQPKPKLKLVKSAAEATDGPGAPPKVESARVKSGRKLLFRCLHCRSTLAIRAVEKTSKLVCPHCSKSMFVTPAGRLQKDPPSSMLRKATSGSVQQGGAPPTQTPSSRALGSVAGGSSRRVIGSSGSSAVRRTAGSSAVRRAGSSAVRRKTASVATADPRTPLYLDGVPVTPGQDARSATSGEPVPALGEFGPSTFGPEISTGLEPLQGSEGAFPLSDSAEPTAELGSVDSGGSSLALASAESMPSTHPRAKGAKGGTLGGRCAALCVSTIQGLCLLACLTGPIFLAGGFSSLTASAESPLRSPVPPQVLDQVETLGQQGLRGLQKLMGVSAQ